ncbi:MAG TPA: Rap1a/Tai family immunity protein [Gammaproteobacteria bacterium]|nr:Rap1a/Tai family immunity protein [Gammaproteobacteria bacterium]
MSKFALAAVAVLLVNTYPHQDAQAVEPLSSKEFASHCLEYRRAPEGSDGIFCVRYIQGFIDGAVVTDERVTMNVSDEYTREETFAQRAIRTRLGTHLERFGSSYFAEFCLGEPIPLAEVVDHIVTRLEGIEFKPQMPLAREFVYRVLRDDYPCKSTDSDQ